MMEAGIRVRLDCRLKMVEVLCQELQKKSQMSTWEISVDLRGDSVA